MVSNGKQDERGAEKKKEVCLANLGRNSLNSEINCLLKGEHPAANPVVPSIQDGVRTTKDEIVSSLDGTDC